MKRSAETAMQVTFRRLAEVASQRVKLIDRALFWLLKSRLSRFALTGDSSDALADRVCMLVQMIQEETSRRNREVAHWQRAARAAKSAQASRRQFLSTDTEPIEEG